MELKSITSQNSVNHQAFAQKPRPKLTLGITAQSMGQGGSIQSIIANAPHVYGPNNPKPSTTQGPKPQAQFSISNGFTELVFANSQAAALQRQTDKQNGIGLVEGAKHFAKQTADLKNALSHYSTLAERIQVTETVTAENASSQPGFLEALSKPLGEAVSSLGATLPKSGSSQALDSAAQLVNNFGQGNVANSALNGAAVGSYLGSIFPGIGTAIGGVVGTAAGAILGFFHGGKHRDQVARDQLRSFLQVQGFIDSQYGIQLANGSRFDIGIDGGARLSNLDGSERRPYDTDASNPLTAQLIGWINPLAEVLTGGDDKLRSDLVGYLVNAALSNATDLESARQNVLAFYEKLGATQDDFLGALSELQQGNAITPEQLAAYQNGIATLVAEPEQYQPEAA